MNMIKYYKHPILFYFLSIVIPWALWFLAAYLSHLQPAGDYYADISGLLLLLGIAAPTVVAFTMMYLDPHLRGDLFGRLFSISAVRPFYIFLTCFLMLGSILLAQGISLLFGYSIDQFTLAQTTTFTFSLFPAWIILFLAPLLEELAWHSYGTDCLRARFTLFTTSIIFGVFWVFWHFPLSFVEGYYHSNIREISWLYSANFAVSLFPFVLLMNWLYYKTQRNILVAIAFHITAGIFNESFSTHPDSKLIQTGLLMFLSIFILYMDREMFFKKTIETE